MVVRTSEMYRLLIHSNPVLKVFDLCFNWHSPSLCQVLPESGTLWNQLLFVMCCFVISATVVPWVEMIWTGSGWLPVLSSIQQFTTPKVFCIICAASTGPLWWVTPCIFYGLLHADGLLQLCQQPCFMVRDVESILYRYTFIIVGCFWKSWVIYWIF